VGRVAEGLSVVGKREFKLVRWVSEGVRGNVCKPVVIGNAKVGTRGLGFLS